MPVYEFRCLECSHTFETRTPTMAVPAELACPQCGGKELKRLLSSFFAHSASAAPARPEKCRDCPGGGPSCPFSN